MSRDNHVIGLQGSATGRQWTVQLWSGGRISGAAYTSDVTENLVASRTTNMRFVQLTLLHNVMPYTLYGMIICGPHNYYKTASTLPLLAW